MSKTIGIVGGMTPESTSFYYEYITRTYYKKFGNYGFPEIIIYSVSFQQYVDWMNIGNWNAIAEGLTRAVVSLKNAGADFAIIATNTMHKVFHEIEQKSPIPLLSIIDSTAKAIKKRAITNVGLLGTVFTMREKFYKEGLAKFDIKTLVPNESDQQTVNRIIFNELGTGEIKKRSKKVYMEIINRLGQQGAEGVILGCTEIPLLVDEKDSELPLFNTSAIHAEDALEFSLK